MICDTAESPEDPSTEWGGDKILELMDAVEATCHPERDTDKPSLMPVRGTYFLYHRSRYSCLPVE